MIAARIIESKYPLPIGTNLLLPPGYDRISLRARSGNRVKTLQNELQ